MHACVYARGAPATDTTRINPGATNMFITCTLEQAMHTGSQLCVRQPAIIAVPAGQCVPTSATPIVNSGLFPNPEDSTQRKLKPELAAATSFTGVIRSSSSVLCQEGNCNSTRSAACGGENLTGEMNIYSGLELNQPRRRRAIKISSRRFCCAWTCSCSYIFFCFSNMSDSISRLRWATSYFLICSSRSASRL